MCCFLYLMHLYVRFQKKGRLMESFSQNHGSLRKLKMTEHALLKGVGLAWKELHYLKHSGHYHSKF